jgi:orotate phosphoribosyltransferase
MRKEGATFMSELEKQLLAVLAERSFMRGTFRLASGDISDHYIDIRMSCVYSRSAWLIGEVLFERTQKLGIDAIGGLEVGAVPLTTAAVISYHQHGRAMEGFWVRDKVKDHGTQKLIEGNLRPGSRVVIVEDVATRGTSALKAIREVKGVGCQVVMVLSLVDRLCGAAERFREEGVENYQSVFTIRDFGVEVRPSTGSAP